MFPRLHWPMLIYDMPSSTAEDIDQKVSRHLRRLLGAPPGLTTSALDSKSAKPSLPLSSVLEEYKVMEVRALLTVTESRNPKISLENEEIKM